MQEMYSTTEARNSKEKMQNKLKTEQITEKINNKIGTVGKS